MSQLPAEARVREIIRQEGIHVVHLWAPWCPNSIDGLRAGWGALVEAHPEVRFTFVTVWSGGASGREALEGLGLAGRVEEVVAAGTGTQEDKAGRRRAFLGLPLTWVPSTWIFREGGTLAFAFNYGEMAGARIAEALEDVRRAW